MGEDCSKYRGISLSKRGLGTIGWLLLLPGSLSWHAAWAYISFSGCHHTWAQKAVEMPPACLHQVPLRNAKSTPMALLLPSDHDDIEAGEQL
jgi:hypothetical protein